MKKSIKSKVWKSRLFLVIGLVAEEPGTPEQICVFADTFGAEFHGTLKCFSLLEMEMSLIILILRLLYSLTKKN